MSKLVREIMTPVERLVFLSWHDSVQNARDEMKRHNIHSVLVQPREGMYGIMIFTQTDLMLALGRVKDPTQAILGQYASPVEDVADPDWSCDECKRRMAARRHKHLPVVDRNGALMGLISFSDVLNNC